MKILLPGILSLAAISSAAASDPLAFPTAEGFGAHATGGRGGEVYHVTNLNDEGPGSFRDATSKGPRMVVFDVGGTIELASRMSVASDITIAGQSAPGEGICVSNYEVSFSKSHNIIVRYMRFRHGPTPRQEKKYVIGLGECQQVIFDHLSIQWGRWDCIGFSKSNDVTIQNCIIGEGIAPQRFGCLCQSDNVTFSHNLWIDNQSRNPKAKGTVQYINNVVYNWGVTGYVGGHSAESHSADLINNYFIKGPSSSQHFAGEFTASDIIYQSGNYVDLNTDGVLNGKLALPSDFPGATIIPKATMTPPVPVTVDTAQQALAKVMATAGDSLRRDSIDLRLIAQVSSLGRAGQIIHDPAEVGGPCKIAGGPPALDTDRDGIPDQWEKTHGLNPHSPDSNKLAPSGYTYLEEYLNEMGRAKPAL